MPMTHDEQQTFALLYYWIGHNRHELKVLRGDDLFQAMYTGIHAKAEAGRIPDAVVRRMIRDSIESAERGGNDDVDEGEEYG
jgi:hypothetical protein